MVEKNLLEKTEGNRIQYETPSVTMTCWSDDVLATNYSREVGGEYDSELWG